MIGIKVMKEGGYDVRLTAPQTLAGAIILYEAHVTDAPAMLQCTGFT